MQDALRTYLGLAMGLTETSRKRVRKVVKDAVGRGNATAEQLKAMSTDLMAANSANRDALVKLVKFEVDRALGRVGLATAEEVAELTAQIRSLEGQLREAKAESAPAATKAATTPARKTATTKATATKATATKATATKATATKAAAKRPARSTTAASGPTPARTTRTRSTAKTTPAKARRATTGGEGE